MLVLTRKSDQELLIDGNIRVRILSIDKGRVRLGITAPRHVPVARAELNSKARPIATSSQSPSAGCFGEPEPEMHHDFAALI